MIHMRDFDDFEEKNLRFLVKNQIDYTLVQATSTGIEKSILDATAPVRAFLLENGIHDYSKQKQGKEEKIFIETYILTETNTIKTKTSFYRPETKKGDPRLWVYALSKYLKSDEIFLLLTQDKKLYVINLTQIDIERVCSYNYSNPIKDFILKQSIQANSIAEELLTFIKDNLKDWVECEVSADTGIGRTLESKLGLKMNSSKLPDYKGIELKTKRQASNTRGTLFTKAPNWTLSKYKNGKEVVEKYGYVKEGTEKKTLEVTLNAIKPNRQTLMLAINEEMQYLEVNSYKDGTDNTYKKKDDVVVWKLIDLHNALLVKHKETFWIDVENKIINGKEYFRVTSIEHTKNPMVHQFDILIAQGLITLDFLVCRPSGNGDTYSFKMKKKDLSLLFPEKSIYKIQ